MIDEELNDTITNNPSSQNDTPVQEDQEVRLLDIEDDDFSDDWGDEDDEIIEDDDDSDIDGFELPEGFEQIVQDLKRYDESKDDEASSNIDNVSESVDGWFKGLDGSVSDGIIESRATNDNNDIADKNVNEPSPMTDDSDIDSEASIISSDDEVIDERVINESYSELESVRESTEGIESSLADISYLDKIKKRDKAKELTADEIKSQKQKQAEARKRKRQEENDIFARRYKAKSINAAVAQSNPILYFYNAVLNKEGNVKLFNVYQVLQDRFLGKLVPQLWRAVAESTDRILEMDMANLIEQIKICEEYPDYDFVLTISTRFFTKPAVLAKLIALIDRPISNLVMAFDCVSLQNLGTAAKSGLGEIKAKGVKVILDNTEKVSMTTLSELEFDYLRIDSRYYELGNFKSEGFLRLLTGWAQEIGIPTIATYCDHEDMVEYMLYMGVDLVQGNAVSRPMRTVPNAVNAITPVTSMREE